MKNWEQHKKKTVVSIGFVLFVVVGTYNSIVMNSQSLISGTDVRFVKRLDEVYGITKHGNRQAASIKWQKISNIASAPVRNIPQLHFPKKVAAAVVAESTESNFNDFSQEMTIPAAAVQETLNLSLNEVVNTKKWPSGLQPTEFNGSLSTNNGVIESLSVGLPSSDGISVSFSEMTGNVFEYDYNNELYSGMMYQIDQNSYMVTLTNGPLEGTRLRFVGEPSDEQKDLMAQQTTENEMNQYGNSGGDGSEISDKEAQSIALVPEEHSTEGINYETDTEAPTYEPGVEVAGNVMQAEEISQDQDYNYEDQQEF